MRLTLKSSNLTRREIDHRPRQDACKLQLGNILRYVDLIWYLFLLGHPYQGWYSVRFVLKNGDLGYDEIGLCTDTILGPILSSIINKFGRACVITQRE